MIELRIDIQFVDIILLMRNSYNRRLVFRGGFNRVGDLKCYIHFMHSECTVDLVNDIVCSKPVKTLVVEVCNNTGPLIIKFICIVVISFFDQGFCCICQNVSFYRSIRDGIFNFPYFIRGCGLHKIMDGSFFIFDDN